MGLIRKLKELFDAKKYIQEAMESQDRHNEQYAAMLQDELTRLSDNDLYAAVLYRIDHELRLILGKNPDGEIPSCVRGLSSAKRTVYLLSVMDAEVSMNGLCRFLVHTCHGFAGDLAGCLRDAGANQHLSLLEEFTARSQLDLNSVPAFDSERSPGFPEWENQYPFEQFDTSYAKLPSLETNLVSYIRLHIAEF